MVPKQQQKRDPRGIGRKGGFKSLGSHLPQNAYKGKGIPSLKMRLIES